MITINRKVLNVRINNCYFVDDLFSGESQVDITGFAHSFLQRATLKATETLHIDLTNDADTILREMNKSNRSQIKKAEGKGLQYVINGNPTDEEIVKFKRFYNEFARNKKTHLCKSFHLKTLRLLSKKKDTLFLTSINNSSGETLCYRAYVSDGKNVLTLYSASHFRMEKQPEIKRLMSEANRYLIWRNILSFKQSGHVLYDFGGLTNNENIRNYKLGFGGKVVTTYSGYLSFSWIGKVILQLRNWNLLRTGESI